MQISFRFMVLTLIPILGGRWSCVRATDEDDPLVTTLSPAEEYKNYPYCFRFTWLGPKYNKDSQYKNVTCENLLKKATGIPCFHPLVVTNNSNVPDTEYMWNEYKDKPSQVACRLVRGEVCARFTYRYNGAIENITYMCAKMNVDNESSTTSACYSEDRSGREIEVCVCESAAGKTPCNRSSTILLAQLGHPVVLVMLAMFQLLLLQVCLNR
ncbi:uncharacterized protein LOC131690112 isoform X2 [Topomyia yanbarensis]|uniref:uncharacterized protein LOC131690112 isoform X2 n=1 Tax=Topomyia yanbarensis TaxID=2498891 RepID=UPI00273BFDD8|nr:uncharacterized protein LOC131690112 isoform X2 [Topomyia yanbarensis]